MTIVYRAYAPASAANLSVGFDLLGAALKPIDGQILGDEIYISQAEKGQGFSLDVTGRYAGKLSSDPKKNIVYDAFVLFSKMMQQKGLVAPDVHMGLSKNLPVCSGLGSSAASSVAAVIALDAVAGNPLSEQEKIDLMGQLESSISGGIHYDNIAPCYFGGLQLIINENGVISQTLPDFDNWYWVSCFPGLKVSTSEARAILPPHYSRSDTITYGRHLAAFVDACHRGDHKLAARCLSDVIAEPYRKQLIPGFDAMRDFALQHGAMSAGISGSGSSVFAVFEDLAMAEQMKVYLEREFIANEDGFCHICKLDRRGAYVEKVED
ncbi:MAG: homoserine kinase [Succinivibrio sp.]|nr:homoserine kinase [Succinivibrio sp.]